MWDWNPEIINLGGFGIRWYSLMFVAAFILGLRLMKRFTSTITLLLKTRSVIYVRIRFYVDRMRLEMYSLQLGLLPKSFTRNHITI